jgi:hypothetical protein
MDELQGVLEREVPYLPSSILGHPECSAVDGAAEADVGARGCAVTNVCSHLPLSLRV